MSRIEKEHIYSVIDNFEGNYLKKKEGKVRYHVPQIKASTKISRAQKKGCNIVLSAIPKGGEILDKYIG